MVRLGGHLSRYLVDKFLYQVDGDPEALDAYGRDPAAFVATWEQERAGLLGDTERTSGHTFTEDERRALAAVDYEALYAMGAHPFVLWTLMIPLLQRDEPDFKKVAELYAARIRRHGRPDFGT